MDVDVLAGTVRQVRGATLEVVEIAAAGRFGVDDAKEVAQTGVDHVCVGDLVDGAVTFRLALEVARALPRQPALVPAQRA
jgi:nicotinate-nucleotide pyrophosphorylase